MTQWTVACQVPLSMGFSRQEYWSELPVPSPGDVSHPGIEPRSPALQADALPSEPAEKLWISPGKNTGVGSPALLQGIFITQGSNSGLWYCSQILYCVRKVKDLRTSLVVQWLRLQASNTRALSSIHGEGTRSWMLHLSSLAETKGTACCSLKRPRMPQRR